MMTKYQRHGIASGCFWLCLEAPVMIAERRRLCFSLFLQEREKSWLRLRTDDRDMLRQHVIYRGFLQHLAYNYCLLTITG